MELDMTETGILVNAYQVRKYLRVMTSLVGRCPDAGKSGFPATEPRVSPPPALLPTDDLCSST